MNSCKSFFLLALSLALLRCSGQSFPETLTAAFREQSEKALPEKIFAHTDKQFYFTGEIVWFKLYAVDGWLHRPLELSKVAYVELLDAAGKPALQAKIAMDKGSGSGSLYLPATLASGAYTLRAYTNWMKNFGGAYFFRKTITVINGKKTYAEDKKPPAPQYDIQFFPEGGNLVSGLESRIGFRVVDQYGRGVDGQGWLVDDLSDTLRQVETLRKGIGNFLLTPKKGRSYKAAFQIKGYGELSRALPTAFDQGYVMRVENKSSGKILVHVSASDKEQGSEVYLFAHTRGLVRAALKAELHNGKTQWQIEADSLGFGISNFTLFNADRAPVCERLYFRYPARDWHINLTAEKEYGLRKKAMIGIDILQKGRQPASLSMAVYRIDSLQPADRTNIFDYFWLTADLTGAVESPECYFDAHDTLAYLAMDNLMLTQGWRRFSWNTVSNKNQPLFHFMPEYHGHLITGKIANPTAQTVGKDVPAYLGVPGRRIQMRESTGDDTGAVRFEMRNFYGREVIVQANGRRDSLYRISLNDPFSVDYSAERYPHFSLNAYPASALLDRYIGAQAQNIYYANRLSQFIPPAIDSSAFYGKPDAAYLLDDYTRFTTMEEILREYVPLVFVKKREGHYHFSLFEKNSRSLFSRDPLVLLDGVPVFDIDRLMKYDPLKIWKLEVAARNYFYGDLAFDGIVNFITYRGDLPDLELDPGATVIDYEGLQRQREFFSPVYETPEQIASRSPDLRNLLLWSPDIKLNSGARGKASFYTSDIPGRYGVTVQGFSPDGEMGSAEIFFDVK